MQADLIDVRNLSSSNNGTTFLLTCICTFAKKTWIAANKNKKSNIVLIPYRHIINRREVKVRNSYRKLKFIIYGIELNKFFILSRSVYNNKTHNSLNAHEYLNPPVINSMIQE